MSPTYPDHSLHPDKLSKPYILFDTLATSLAALAALSVNLRFHHRKRHGLVWWDDYAALASIVFAFATYIACMFHSAPSFGGAGYHQETYTLAQLNTYFKCTLAADVLYNASIALSKTSVLLFYRRIFSVDVQFLRFMRVIVAVTMCAFVASIGGLIFAFNPVRAGWTANISSTTIHEKAFWITTGVINAVLDACIGAIAQWKVLRLQMAKGRRAMISVVLLLGMFTIVASVLRIVYLGKVEMHDVTYTLSHAILWMNLEMNMSIICACLPTLYGFIRQRRIKCEPRTPRRSLVKSGWRWKTPETDGSCASQSQSHPDQARYLENSIRMPESAYCAIAAAGSDRGSSSMEALGLVRVKIEYSVR